MYADYGESQLEKIRCWDRRISIDDPHLEIEQRSYLFGSRFGPRFIFL